MKSFCMKIVILPLMLLIEARFMKLKVLNKEEIYKSIAKEIVDLINKKPNTVLGLATGSSPVGVYKELINFYKNNEVSFKNVQTFNLDEYVGLSKDNAQSYYYFMNEKLFKHIDIDINNTHIPNGIDYQDTIMNYEKDIENAGGIDLQILGIGSNGHIAFNEPGTDFNSEVHLVQLKESTRKDNSRFFVSLDEVPKQAITMGLKSIMKAKRIVLIAIGVNKATAINQLLNEEISINLPASILKMHPNVTIYCDEEAMVLAKRR